MILSRAGLSTKPPAGARINYGVTGPNLYGAWLFNEGGGAPFDLHTMARATVSSGIKWSATQTGIGLRHTGTSDVMTLKALNTANGGLPLSKMTMFFGYEKTDATLRIASPVSTSLVASGANLLNIHTPYSNGITYFDFGGNVEGTSRLSIAGLTTTGQQVWAFSVGPRGMEIWQNGLRRASNAGVPVRTNNGDPLVSGGSGISDLSITRFLIIFNEQLSPMRIQQISHNPYTLFLKQSPDVSLLYNFSGTPITGLRPAMRVPNVLVF